MINFFSTPLRMARPSLANIQSQVDYSAGEQGAEAQANQSNLSLQRLKNAQDTAQIGRLNDLRSRVGAEVAQRGSGRFGQMIAMQQSILDNPDATPQMKAQAQRMLDYYNSAEANAKQQLSMMAEIDPQGALEQWSQFAGGGDSVYEKRLQNSQLAEPLAIQIANQEPAIIAKAGEIARLVSQVKTNTITKAERDSLPVKQQELAELLRAYNGSIQHYEAMAGRKYETAQPMKMQEVSDTWNAFKVSGNEQIDYSLDLAKTQTELQNKIVDSAKSDQRTQSFNKIAQAWNTANAMGSDFSNPANTYAMVTALAKALSPETSAGLDQLMAISGQAPHSMLTSGINEIVRAKSMLDSAMQSEEGHSLAESAQKGAEYVISPNMAKKISEAMGNVYSALSNTRQNIINSLSNEVNVRVGPKMQALEVTGAEVKTWIEDGALSPIDKWGGGTPAITKITADATPVGRGAKPAPQKNKGLSIKRAGEQVRAKSAPKAPLKKAETRKISPSKPKAKVSFKEMENPF